MDAVILAAGKGKRMGDMTKETPKPLLEIRNKPIIEYMLDNLRDYVDRVVIIIGHLGYKIKDYFGNEYRGIRIRYIEQNQDKPGTGGAIFELKNFLHNDFIVLNGDCYYTKEDIEKITSEKYAILGKSPNPIPNGGILKDENGNLLEIKEKEDFTPICNVGLYKLRKSIFDYRLEKSNRGEFEIVDYLNKLAKDEDVKVIMTDTWAHISYESDLLNLNKVINGYGTELKEFSNVIFVDEGKVLIQQRSNEEWLPFRKHWQFMGGFIEEGEEPLECAIREMKEEIDVDLKENDLKFMKVVNGEKRNDYIYICKTKIDVDKVILKEGMKIEYVGINDIQKLELVPGDKFIIENIKNELISEMKSDETKRMNIPLFKTYSDEDDIEYISKIIKRGTYWAAGKEIDEFEKEIAKYVGTEYAVTFSSGTSALHVALLAHDVKNYEVITPSFTFISTATSIIHAGGIPVFAETEKDTLGLDAEDVLKKITSKTKAIIALHYAGVPSKDIFKLRSIAKEHNLILIEDAAEAFGAKINNQFVGTIGDSGMYSFCQSKIITTGEGGAIVTNSRKVYEKLKLLRSHGRVEVGEDYFSYTGDNDYIEQGFNYRMPTMNAALGLAQMKKIKFLINSRRRVANKYNEALSKINKIRIFKDDENQLSVYQLYSFIVEDEKLRNQLKDYLNAHGVSSKVYFPPSHLKTLYKDNYGYKEGDLPNTEKISKQVLSIPMYPHMDDVEQDYVINNINKFFGEK